MAEHRDLTQAEARYLDELRELRSTSISAWQARAADWTDSRFPDDTLKDRALVLGEETGEVLRCVLKASQDIRGGREHWLAELEKEAVDVLFCVLALAHRAGFSLAEVLDREWARISRKQYAAMAVTRARATQPGGSTRASQWYSA